MSCSAPSKTFNVPGLNTSLTFIPDEKNRRLFEQILRSHGGANENPFGLAAMEAAYQEGGPWLDSLRHYLKENYNLLKEKLPSRFKLICSEGTYLAWVDVSSLGDEAAVKDFFYRKYRLGVQLGSGFGPGGEGFVRINFALPRKKLSEALVRMLP